MTVQMFRLKQTLPRRLVSVVRTRWIGMLTLTQTWFSTPTTFWRAFCDRYPT